MLKPRHKTRVQRLPILSRLPPIVGRFSLQGHSRVLRGASTSRGTRTRTPNRASAFEAGVSTNSTTLAKEKGSGNKHERQPRDHSAPNRRDTRTPAAPSASPTRVRGHSQPANPDRPNLLTNTESTRAQTPKRHPHTPSAPSNAATHPSVTAPAAASIPVLFPLPGRRSRT